MHEFRFDRVALPASVEALRQDVRDFIAEQRAAGTMPMRHNSWHRFDADFSRQCGLRGYIGMTWPKRYGGQEKTKLERFVVTEELLAAGGPLGAHWVADRQSGHQILAHGTEAARQAILPRIAAGECFIGIGMSEPDTGSDLAAVKTRGTPVEGGWRVNGTKVWTSNAHRAHYLIALVRTAAPTEDRHAGLSQFIVDLSKPGVTVRPVVNLYGSHDFNEVVFEDHFVPDEMVLGQIGGGWKTVGGELVYERAGPDRFMSTYQTLLESMRVLGPDVDDRAACALGRIVAHLATVRRMSTSIAGMLEAGREPNVEAALVKDIGTTLEREIPEVFRDLIAVEPSMGDGSRFSELLGMSTLRSPGFTLRGGTREILRGVIARGLGLR
ncbi:MAG: acyl-CoA dehydrogenase [Variovorax sp.]|nr:acyl-CoA dehydrogenase [Variovorax sp.]